MPPFSLITWSMASYIGPAVVKNRPWGSAPGELICTALGFIVKVTVPFLLSLMLRLATSVSLRREVIRDLPFRSVSADLLTEVLGGSPVGKVISVSRLSK